MEGQSGVARSIIDGLDSSDMIKWHVNMLLFEVSLMNFILWISNKMKCKVKVVLLEVLLMKFILDISKEIKW